MTEVAGVVYDTFADKATYSPFVYKSFGSPMYNRVGKTGSKEPWSREHFVKRTACNNTL